MICRKTIICYRTAHLSHQAFFFIPHCIPLHCNTSMLTFLTLLSLTQTQLLCRLPQKLEKSGNMRSFKAQKCNSPCMGSACLVRMGSEHMQSPHCQEQTPPGLQIWILMSTHEGGQHEAAGLFPSHSLTHPGDLHKLYTCCFAQGDVMVFSC